MLSVTIGGYLICSLASLAGGFIDAIAGGGALLTIPALLLSGVPPHFALGTNKIGACCGTTVALINFSSRRLVKWHMVFWGIGFSFAGSWLGSLLALYLDSAVLGKILVILLPFAMLATLLPHKKDQENKNILDGWRFWLGVPLICFVIGCYDGFFGPATGTFIILALHWILGLGLIESSGTAKAFNLASNASASISFIWHGVIIWSLAIPMALCFMLGNWLGSKLAIKVGAKIVRSFLTVSLLILLATLIWQYFVAPL